jgi:hypothetical protein
VNQKKSKFDRYSLVSSTIVAVMTVEEARLLIVEGINYAAYKETESSLYDSDKNRLFGSEHYKSGLHIVKRSSWAPRVISRKKW